MAWAVNIALGRPEGEQLLTNIPEMETYGPVAGAMVGFFVLSMRQGWGVVVAFANGIWAGALSVIVSGVIYVTVHIVDQWAKNIIQDFDGLVLQLQVAMEPLLEEVVNLPLLIVSLGAAAIVGVVTEGIHWVLHKVYPPKTTEGATPASGP